MHPERNPRTREHLLLCEALTEMKPPAPVPGVAGSLMKTTSPLILAYPGLRQPGSSSDPRSGCASHGRKHMVFHRREQ